VFFPKEFFCLVGCLSSFGKLSISSALGGFLMFRPMVEELWNIEQFCNKNITISKLQKLGQ
jgi:hypothetical protein